MQDAVGGGGGGPTQAIVATSARAGWLEADAREEAAAGAGGRAAAGGGRGRSHNCGQRNVIKKTRASLHWAASRRSREGCGRGREPKTRAPTDIPGVRRVTRRAQGGAERTRGETWNAVMGTACEWGAVAGL